MTVFISLGGTTNTTFTNQARATAKLSAPTFIDGDAQGNLYIWDKNRIHKWVASTDQISTIIGGGSGAAAYANTVVGGRNFQIREFPGNASVNDEGSHFDVLANGDIIFRSEFISTETVTNRFDAGGNQVRYFNASTDTIYSIFIDSGIGTRYSTTTDTSKCRLLHFSYTYNPDSFAFTHFHYDAGYINRDTTECNLPNYQEGWAQLDGPSNISEGAILSKPSVSTSSQPPVFNQSHRAFTRTGKNGKSYMISQDKGVYEYVVATNSYVAVYGNGINGFCSDGTLATNCASHVADAFVARDGRVYVNDRGQVRTIDDEGKVRTLFGQSINYGNGLTPSVARFGSVGLIRMNNSTGEIFLLDRLTSYLKKFKSDGVVTHVAGNGRGGAIDSTVQPATQTRLNAEYTNADVFDLVPGTNDIIATQVNSPLIYRLRESVGVWEVYAGNASGTKIRAADGLTQGSIAFYGDSFSMPAIVKHLNGKIALYHSDISGPSGAWANIFYKLYDLSDQLRQGHLLGTVTTAAASSCANGTNADACTLASSWTYRPEIAYNSSTGEYLVPDPPTQSIYRIGTQKNLFVNLGKTFRGVAIDLPSQRIYHCSTDGTHYRPYVYKIDTNENIPIPGWPSGYHCSGESLLIDGSGASRRLIFPVTKNGVSNLVGIGAMNGVP